MKYSTEFAAFKYQTDVVKHVQRNEAENSIAEIFFIMLCLKWFDFFSRKRSFGLMSQYLPRKKRCSFLHIAFTMNREKKEP